MRSRFEKSALVARVVENGVSFPSPRSFAGRGRVRGSGDWPLLFNYALNPWITMSSGRLVTNFSSLANRQAPHPASPRKEAGRGEYPIELNDPAN